MNTKRFVWAVIACAVVITVIEMIGHGYFMTNAYRASMSLWRSHAAMNGFLWLGYLATIITSVIMVYIYHKGYEAKGPGAIEGLRFGIIIGLFMAVPMAAWTYVTMPVMMGLAIGWFFIALTKFSLAGVAVGMIYKK